MMKKLFALLILVIFLSAAGNLSFAEDDFQYWSRYTVKAIDTQFVDYISYWDLRLYPDAGRPGLWLTTQKLQYDFFRYLSFVTGYTYLESRVKDLKSGNSEFKYQNRFELEANPHWETNWLKVSSRNRIEFRWIEDKGSDNARFRQLWEFEVPLKFKSAEFLKSIYLNNELFIDFHEHKINENRVTPIGVTFRLSHKVFLKIFYMIQSRKGTHDWLSNQIVGTNLSISF